MGHTSRQADANLVEHTESGREAIVWEIRFLVRLAVIVGAGLAMVGATLQAVTRNPLADPHLLDLIWWGVWSYICSFAYRNVFRSFDSPLLAFVGALVATLIVLSVSHLAQATSADRLVLSGVAISFIIMAAANLLIFLGDQRLPTQWYFGCLVVLAWPNGNIYFIHL